MCNFDNHLLPTIGIVTDIVEETSDVKTFRVEAIGGGKPFEHMPGQCAILSAPGLGEALFSITSSPTNKEYLEFSIKRCGSITDFLHFDWEPGQEIAIRGPYGNHFPVEDKLKGNICGFKSTSCADQLAKAVRRAYIGMLNNEVQNFDED